jgi:hypothetical protein
MNNKKLVFNMWKTGRFSSKIDLIKYFVNNYQATDKDVDMIEEVLTNIDKYEEEFKQTKYESFFIELLKLMKKYDVHIGADIYNCDNEPYDLDTRIYFGFKDKTFVQDKFSEICPTANVGFINYENNNEKYNFPAVKDFENEGIANKF